MVQNKGLIYKEPPVDWPVEGKNLAIEDRGFDLDAQPPKDGITTKNFYVSFDVRYVFLFMSSQSGLAHDSQIMSAELSAPRIDFSQRIDSKADSRILQPYQRGRMRAPHIKSYNQPFELGKPITNFAVSKILKSNNPNFSEGEMITGM